MATSNISRLTVHFTPYLRSMTVDDSSLETEPKFGHGERQFRYMTAQLGIQIYSL